MRVPPLIPAVVFVVDCMAFAIGVLFRTWIAMGRGGQAGSIEWTQVTIDVSTSAVPVLQLVCLLTGRESAVCFLL